MKKFIGLIITIIVSMLLAGFVVNSLVQKESLKPILDTQQGQIIFTTKIATFTAVEVGYKILANDFKYSESNDTTQQPVQNSRAISVPKPRSAGYKAQKSVIETPIEVVEVPTVKTTKKSGEEINEYVLENEIKRSGKTFFYSGKEHAIDNVTVRVYSITPFRENYSVIKVKIINDKQQYFFIANINLLSANDKKNILGLYLNPPMVAPERTADCYILINTQPGTPVMLKLTESGGKNRNFNINFSLP